MQLAFSSRICRADSGKFTMRMFILAGSMPGPSSSLALSGFLAKSTCKKMLSRNTAMVQLSMCTMKTSTKSVIYVYLICSSTETSQGLVWLAFHGCH